MQESGISSTRPCTCLEDTSALRAACSQLLRGKASALLAAGRAQLVQRQPWCFRPVADPTSLTIFSLLS